MLGMPSANRAGVVVQFDGGGHISLCVPFAEETISGLELLQRSGLNIANDGGAVCRIESQGCDFPVEPCFCQCDLSTPGCRFWAYSIRVAGRWRSSGAGASQRRVADGDIDGWRWPGGPPAVEPTIDELCDPLRLAPLFPAITTTCDALSLSMPFQGDDNADASARARVRRVGAEWPDDYTAARPVEGQVTVQWAGLLAGDYEVELQLADPDGVNASSSWLLTTTVGTVADLSIEPASPYVQKEVAFADTSRGIEPITRTWRFGDGSAVQHGERVVHAYSTSGPYTVTLTVASSCGEAVARRPVAVRSFRLIFPRLYSLVTLPYPFEVDD